MKTQNFTYLCLALFFLSACTKDKLDTDLLIGTWQTKQIIVNDQAVIFEIPTLLMIKEKDQYTKNQESGAWSFDKKANTLNLESTNDTEVYTILELSPNELRLEREFEQFGETYHTIEVYFKQN